MVNEHRVAHRDRSISPKKEENGKSRHYSFEKKGQNNYHWQLFPLCLSAGVRCSDDSRVAVRGSDRSVYVKLLIRGNMQIIPINNIISCRKALQIRPHIQDLELHA